MLTVADALFRIALATAPPEFRREYGRAMRADFGLALADARAAGGTVGAATYAARAIVDVLGTALRTYAAALLRDLTYAVRALRATPAFTAVVVATLTLAIGANAAAFSILRAVVLAPLPYAAPERLVEVRSNLRGVGFAFSLPDYADVTARTSATFARSGAFTFASITMTGHGRPRKLATIVTTAGTFETLGVAPQLGRFFDERDGVRGAARVAILSDALWRSAFGADPRAIGTLVDLDATPYRIVGIAPPGFRQPEMQRGFQPADLWTPIARDGLGTPFAQRGYHEFGVVARLRPGVTPEAAGAAVAAAFAPIAARHSGDDATTTLAVEPLAESLVGSARPLLLALFAAVGIVLVIACANVANLLLSRAASRDRELAVRIAIGASRGRIVTQLLVEAFALAAVGGALGIALAVGIVRGFVALDPPNVPRIETVAVDASALLFTFGVVGFCTLAAGLAPALASARSDVASALGAAGRGGDAHRGARARAALVACEIALTLALVVGAGLVVRSYVALTAQPLGFEPAGVSLVGPIDLPDRRYADPQRVAAFLDRVSTRARALPGVRAVENGFALPFTGMQFGTALTIVGRTMRPGFEPEARIAIVSPGATSLLGATVLAGRTFDASDRFGSRDVVVVNATFAKRFFPGRSPIGARVVPGLSLHPGAPPPRTIVGVIGDLRTSFAKDVAPTIYLPSTQYPFGQTFLLVRADVPSAISAVAATVADVDPLLPMPRVVTMSSLLARDVARQRLTVVTLAALAIVALALSIAGVYAVVSYGVAQRTHEFGVRMALGADARAIVRTVLGGALRLAALGIALGLVLAGAGTRFLANQLFQTEPLDPMTFASVTALVVVAALVAAFVPARRATRVDPIVALRYE